MKIKLLHSYGKQDINEYDYELPEMQEDQIMVKTIMCGVCRSDIGAYGSFEEPMPFGRQGHEGLSEVIKVGNKIKKIKKGDIVSTISDPAYGDYYYAKENEATVVPEAHFKYILQPVACAVNIIEKTIRMVYSSYITRLWDGISLRDEPILLLGTGFMSIIIGQYCNAKGIKLDVVGSSNKDLWTKYNYELKNLKDVLDSGKKYKVIIDLTSKVENWDIITKQLAELEAVICYAATPFSPISTNFFENCWNCHNIIMPSPRNSDFKEIMDLTRDYVIDGTLETEFIWSKSYSRKDLNEVKQAFEDGLNRTPKYIRGFIKF